MPFRFLYALALVPAFAVGAGLDAASQTEPTPLEQPVAARDKALVESAFSKADVNGDGKITRNEAARMPAIAAKFDALDKDKDGVLSLEEFAAGFIAPD